MGNAPTGRRSWGSVGRRLVPERVAQAYRRRRAAKRYLEEVSQEMLDRQARLDQLEGDVAARRDGLYEHIVSDVVERTEVILSELGRRIDAVAARAERDLAALEDEVAELSKQVARIREQPEVSSADGKAGGVGEGTRPQGKRRRTSRRKPASPVTE
jgi:50S ribosomal subunit-associated GTPase HflX